MNPKDIDAKKSIIATTILSAISVFKTCFCRYPAVCICQETAFCRQDATAGSVATVTAGITMVSRNVAMVSRNVAMVNRNVTTVSSIAVTAATNILLPKGQAEAGPAAAGVAARRMPTNRGSKKNFRFFFALSPACTTFAYK